MIKKISLACIISQNDPHVARSYIISIKEDEKPIDEEVSYLIDKMIFTALDSPKKFSKIGIQLIKLLKSKDKANK